MRPLLVLALFVVITGVGTDAYAQAWQPPADSQRCPSKWGTGDQRGAGNHMKPETVLRATRLIRTGQVFELGRRLEESMPLQTTRTFELHTKRTAAPLGTNRRGGNEEIVLQPREFRLLEYLMKHAGQVVTRTMLLENVWDYHFDPQTNVIDVHISRLRSKIDKGFAQPLLHTIRGAGYMIRDK